MRLLAKSTIPSLVVASLVFAACGSSSSTSTTAASAVKPAAQTGASAVSVKVGSTSLGRVLVNGQGMTLYALSAEHGGKFVCTSSACTAVWHPLMPTAGAAPSTEVGAITTVRRPDGTTQLAYKGEPLYTFTSDQQPGETKGQGFKDVGTWSVVTVGAAAPAGAGTQTSTQSEPAPSGGGGSRY